MATETTKKAMREGVTLAESKGHQFGGRRTRNQFSLDANGVAHTACRHCRRAVIVLERRDRATGTATSERCTQFSFSAAA